MPLGFFDKDLVPLAQFDASLVNLGLYDDDLVDVSSAPPPQVSRHATILGAVRRAPARAGYIRSSGPATRSAITAAIHPRTIRAGVPPLRLASARAAVFAPPTVPPIVGGRITEAIGGRPQPGRQRILVIARPQIGTAPAATGAPRFTFRAGALVNRRASGGIFTTGPTAGIIPGAPRRTTRTTIPLSRLVATGAHVFTPRIGTVVVSAFAKPITMRGGLPPRAPFAGSVRITHPASVAGPSKHVTVRLGTVTRGAISTPVGRIRFGGPSSKPIAEPHVTAIVGHKALRVRVLAPAPRISGPRRGIITGKPRRAFVSTPLAKRPIRTTMRWFHPAPSVAGIFDMAKDPTSVLVPLSATSVTPPPSVRSVTVPASATSVIYP